MSRRPPPKGEIVPEQRVRFQEEFEAIPLREPLPPPPQYHYQQQYQQPQQHVSPHMLPRNASPQQVSPQLPSQNASPHMQPKLQVSPQKQPRNASPRSASPRNASPHSRQPQAQAQAQPAHHRRPSKEGLATHLPPKGDHVRRSTSTAGVSHRQLERLRQAFVQFDTNHSGTIDKEEFKYALRKMKIEMSDAEIDELFDSVDQNADGVIDFEEYMRLMTNRLHETNKEDGMQLAYNLLTDKRTGKISLRTLRRASRDLGVGLTEQDLDVMFVEADTDGDGFIDPKEFDAVVRRCGLRQ